MSHPAAPSEGRRLSIPAYVALLVVYLVIVQGVGLAAQAGTDAEYGTFKTVDDVLRFLWLPVGVSAVFAAGVVTWLGWWRPVLRDDRPVQRWLWAIPAIMIVAILAGTNYGGLVDHGLRFTALFLIGALLVGFTEETMFRGIGVTAFRTNGYPEASVALWVALLFGLAHGTNIFTEGAGAIMQVFVTAAAGYFFYLVRRVSGGILLAMLLHGLWDFGLFTSKLVDDGMYAGAAAFMTADLVLVILLLVRRKHIEVDGRAPAAGTGAAPAAA